MFKMTDEYKKYYDREMAKSLEIPMNRQFLSTARQKQRKARHSLSVVARELNFSGEGSVPLWNDINNAKTVKQLRWAVYHLACRCQLLESEVNAIALEQLRGNIKRGRKAK